MSILKLLAQEKAKLLVGHLSQELVRITIVIEDKLQQHTISRESLVNGNSESEELLIEYLIKKCKSK